MNKSRVNFNEAKNKEKFKILVRYMIKAAENKRCVPYYELENILCVSAEDIGTYAGRLGDYCLNKKLPLLNGLIISSNNCLPSKGFNYYQKQVNKNWGDIVQDCWKVFYVTSTISKLTQNYSKLDKSIEDFLKKNINSNK